MKWSVKDYWWGRGLKTFIMYIVFYHLFIYDLVAKMTASDSFALVFLL